MSRHFPSWIEGFVEYTSPLPSPLLFKRWAGIFTVSAALERKVWVNPYGPNLYPNTYMILTGPPGAGKTTVTYQVQRLLKELPSHWLSSSSLTKAALIDELHDAKRSVIRMGENPPLTEFNFLSIVANELSTLIPAYDSDFMGALTDIWDGYGYAERRRSKDLRINMPAAQFNLLAGTTPAYLAGTLPPGAWDQGFLSRTTIVFSGESVIKPLFESDQTSAKLFDQLAEDLKEIGDLFGAMRWEERAAKLMADWHIAGGPPVPTHPKLASYCIRRTAHLCKLCMIICAARTSTKLITEAHFIEALDLLMEVETRMPEIFKAMTNGGDIQNMKDCWHYAMQYKLKEKRAVPEQFLIEFLAGRVPAYAIATILKTMVQSGILGEQLEPGFGKCYVPLSPASASLH